MREEGHAGYADGDPSDGRAETALCEREQRRREDPVERDERRLVDDRAERPARGAERRRAIQGPQREEHAERDDRDRDEVANRHPNPVPLTTPWKRTA